ncbi:MAG: aminotransferase class I/II-fold pyridoxal phosphate-dependent enzyme, partial [Pontibacterium sp.]
MAKWSNRVSRLTSFKVMDLLKRAKALEAQGFDVVHMAAGEPDFPTAAPIRQAAEQAIAAGLTQYTPAGGIPELRQSIAHWYQSHYGIHITPEQVLGTPGASGALTLLFALLAEEGSK